MEDHRTKCRNNRCEGRISINLYNCRSFEIPYIFDFMDLDLLMYVCMVKNIIATFIYSDVVVAIELSFKICKTARMSNSFTQYG